MLHVVKNSARCYDDLLLAAAGTTITGAFGWTDGTLWRISGVAGRFIGTAGFIRLISGIFGRTGGFVRGTTGILRSIVGSGGDITIRAFRGIAFRTISLTALLLPTGIFEG